MSAVRSWVLLPCLVAVALILGYGAGRNPQAVILLAEAAVAVWLVAGAPIRALVWVVGVGALVPPQTWPALGSFGGVNLYVGDALVVLGILASLVRKHHRPLRHSGLGFVMLMLAVALIHSSSGGVVSLGRMLLPVFALALVGTLLPAGYDLWRDFRWFAVAVAVSVPLSGGNVFDRWHSVVGGPNETALVAASVLGIGLTYRGWWRFGLVGLGALMLFGTASITGTLAACGGLLVYALFAHPRGRISRRLGRVSPLVAVPLAIAAIWEIPHLRDVETTVNAHLFQAEQFNTVMSASDPLFGDGWANIDVTAFAGSVVLGLHNVYLDFIEHLGAVGLLLLVALLVSVWRRGGAVTRVLVVVWCVWVNTTGAYPGVAWGVLGLLIASALPVKEGSGSATQGDVLKSSSVAATGPGGGHLERHPLLSSGSDSYAGHR